MAAGLRAISKDDTTKLPSNASPALYTVRPNGSTNFYHERDRNDRWTWIPLNSDLS